MKKQLKEVLIYTLLAYGISWIIWTPFILNSRGLIEFPFPSLLRFIGPVGTFGPMAAAALLTFGAEGGSGVGALFKRSFSVSFARRWWLVAILLWPMFQGIGYVVGLLLGAELPEAMLLTAPWLLVPVFLRTFVLGGPLGEEMGWRGYALDRLQVRWNAFVSSLVLGVIHACWHLPLWLALGPAARNMPFLLFATNVVVQTVIYTWLYNNTNRSLWPVMLFHTFQNMVIFDVFCAGSSLGAFALAFFGSVAMILFVFGPKRLVRSNTVTESAVS